MKPFVHTLVVLSALFCSACAAADPQTQPHPLAGQPVVIPAPPKPGQVDLPRFPSISPDGKSICFAWRGDLWRVEADGGLATRLTAHPGNEDYNTWSPDGQSIAFNSDRSGYRNVYRMNADGTNIRPVTRQDQPLFITDWSVDGALALTGYQEADVYKSPRPYTVAPQGGPIARLHDAFGRSAAVSPDGRHVAFVRGRAGWDRPFATNSDNRDLWLYDRKEQSFRRLTENLGNDGRPRWLDDSTLLYLSARPPARVNLYRLNIEDDESNAVALTAFTDDDVQSFDVSRDGQTAVMHVWDRLYTLDLSHEKPAPKAITITAPADAGDTDLVQALAGEANQAALSPDGKVMAISARGELFIRSIDSKNPPQRITQHTALDHQPTWSPDGQYLYFTSDRDGTLSIYRAQVALTRSEIEASVNPAPTEEEAGTEDAEEIDPRPLANDAGIERDNGTDENTDEQAKEEEEEEEAPASDRWHDAIRFTIEPVLTSPHHDSDPSPSPDGRTLAFRRGNGQIVLLDLDHGTERVFLDSWDRGTHWAWSADSQYLAVSYEDQNHNADIWVGPADGSTAPVNITKHPAADVLPSFSQDGKVLAFLSARNNDQYDVYTVYLDKSLESLTPQQRADYYDAAKAAAKKLKPLTTPQSSEPMSEEETDDALRPATTNQIDTLDLDDAYLRLRRLTRTDANEWDARILPGGDRAVFTRGDDLFAIGWDGDDEKEIGDGLDFEHLSLTGSHAAIVRGGTAATITIDGGKTQRVRLTGSLRVDRQAVQAQRFTEASRAITMAFYDNTFKGIDWPATTKKYAQLASRTWTTSEFDDVANRYLGLLTASHMGIRSPRTQAENRQSNGQLGARYERIDSGDRVIAIEPQTPAAEGPMRLQIGDVITAIDFQPLADHDTITSRLAGRVGQETAITVLRTREGEADPVELHLLITPISHRAYDRIRYDNWQLVNKAKVDEWSDGRLGYIHIESMNAASLAVFERDLYAACEGRDGLVIDVRDNGGGWTTDRLLASIMTQRHAYTVPRGADPNKTNSYPNNRLFIPRYNLPINTLCNEHSFSNAEIFSHAIKTLGRGTLVGNTTAGGVISTGGTRLLDGTTIRLPFRGWFLPDGADMENNGAVPDLLIPQTPEDEAAGNDKQLRAAVDDLLQRL